MTTETNSNSLSPNGNVGENALKDFQIDSSVQNKTDEKFGAKIVLQVEQIINSGYFAERNIRFGLNRAMAAGKMDMKKFMDFFDMNGKTNYVNISWKAIMIVNTIISRLVGRWMTKKEKASVTATDIVSVKQRQKMYDDAEFVLHNKEQLAQLEGASGVPLTPPDQFMPDDQDHLDLWAEEERRIPEEILYEKGINQVFDENDWGDMGANTRKAKHDSATVGLVCAETIADSYGRIQVNYVKPENAFYSYSEKDDFSDADIKGEIVSWKISQIKNMYPDLEVKDLWEIAKSAKEWNADNKISYSDGWNRNTFLPIDDWNVDIVRFTLESLDNAGYEMKVSKMGKLFVDKKKSKPANDNEYVEKKILNIYRGVYVRQSKKILEWGLEKNMIKPQNYEEIAKVKSPYSFYMYQNVKMRNLAIPEKVEEPVEQMILARLKIQQLVANMRPAGYEYDIDGLQAMDLGDGVLSPLKLMRVTNQTGNVYKRSKTAEGERIESPIKELPNAGSVPQLQALIEIYNYHLQVVRDEIGINEFAEGQTIKPRTGVQNVQTSLEVSFNATDYINDACISLKDQIADNIACLLHDSVEFGSAAYRKLMDEKDVKQRDFKVKIEMLPSTEEITNLMAAVDAYVQTHPDFIMYVSPFKVREIAKRSIKQANVYFERCQKRAIEGAIKQAQHQSEMNMQNQIASNKSAAESDAQIQAQKLDADKQMKEFETGKQKEIELLRGVLAAAAKDETGQLIKMFLPAIQQLVPNISIPLAAENQNMIQAIQQGEQQMAAAQQQQEQPQEEMQEQPMQ